MYVEPAGPHHLPHFHAYYNEYSAVISISSIELIGGSLPKKQLRLTLAWAELHQQKLLNDLGFVTKWGASGSDKATKIISE